MLFIAGVFLINPILHGQDPQKMQALETQLKAAVPKMPEKDVKAFASVC